MASGAALQHEFDAPVSAPRPTCGTIVAATPPPQPHGGAATRGSCLMPPPPAPSPPRTCFRFLATPAAASNKNALDLRRAATHSSSPFGGGTDAPLYRNSPVGAAAPRFSLLVVVSRRRWRCHTAPPYTRCLAAAAAAAPRTSKLDIAFRIQRRHAALHCQSLSAASVPRGFPSRRHPRLQVMNLFPTVRRGGF